MSGRPLHAQLRARLLANLAGGRWQPGDVFPSLGELTRGFGVSAITARRAVHDLVASGCLRTRQGARTRVADGSQAAWHAPRLKRNIAIPFFAASVQQVDAVRGPWTAALLAAVQQELLCHGYCSTLLPFSEDSVAALSSVRAGPFDGLVIFAGSHGTEALAFGSSKVPCVFVGRPECATRWNFVTAQFWEGGRQAASLLLQKGCARFALVKSKKTSLGVSELMDGFCDLLREHGVPPERTVHLETRDVDETSGHAAMARYLANGGRPDGVMASGDLLAAGACRACRERGIGVPEAVKVVGGTGLPQAADYEPPLTVVAYPFGAVAERAVAMLLRLIGRGGRKQRGVTEPMRLTRRRSTGD
jgi:DNA-binding LacI/PurR family transcriptional regulator